MVKISLRQRRTLRQKVFTAKKFYTKIFFMPKMFFKKKRKNFLDQNKIITPIFFKQDQA